MRPKAFGIIQEKLLQYLAWRDVRREQVKVRRRRRISMMKISTDLFRR